MNKLTVIHLNGTKITSKKRFLKEIAEVLEFPSYFGYNFDALEDCLRDLKGKYLVIWTDTDYLNNEVYNQAIEILDKHIELLYFKRKANLEFSKFLPLKIYRTLELDYNHYYIDEIRRS